MKASAGSGKTHALAGHYIDLLMHSDDRYAYRHILAVTFTNKATAEMKARILRDLHVLSRTSPKAGRILTDILHDYGAFSVSTIDRFFQQALRAFSREIGHFAEYQVEVDKRSLVEEAMDRVLDSLTDDDRELIQWLMQSVISRVEQGLKFRIEDGLYEMGARLESEEYRKVSGGKDEDWSKDRLSRIRDACRKVVTDFTKQASLFGLECKRGEVIKKPGSRALAANPEMAAFFEDCHTDYCTAFILDKLICSLGLAGEFSAQYKALLKEKNVMPLDDSNDLLKKIIDGSDTPFVYEKLGVRFDHFLLDEFQDTSAVQWDNFLPLLRESESRGGHNLVVGDVKQSIYRWRGSDWRLLGEQVGLDFPSAEFKPLEYNWRSCGTVVEFNNGFFSYAASNLGLENIYSDVVQGVKTTDPQPGFVRVSFTDDQVAAVKDSIECALSAGARYGEIAVLVRNHREGGAVAEALIAAGIPVISDDSLTLKSSIVVRRLVSLLSVMDNPSNSVAGYLAGSLNVQFPGCHHSLPDLCENLLRQLRDSDPETFSGETLFIQAFMDSLQAWVDQNGNNLRYFLKHWEESDPVIGSPQNASSVRIITVHKSKGLEFPYVIFPFADKVGGYRGPECWCRLEKAGARLSAAAGGIYPVKLEGAAVTSGFAADCEQERAMQTVDNLNLFYVALTRAEKALHIISAPPGKQWRKSRKMSEMLYAWCGGMDDRTFGQMYDFSKLERKVAEESDFPAGYPSFGMSGRFRPSVDAQDFFGGDGTCGSSARLSGIRMHSVLAAVDCADDLPSSLEEEDRRLLAARIGAHPEWFGISVLSGGFVRNEVSIIDENGKEHRPDRVVMDPEGRVSIIDYKFGQPDPRYERQVGRYMSLYRRMGHEDVRGFIWYVHEDKVVEISLSLYDVTRE